MSYAGISVREALERLNSPSNGWYLPQVQRQYVWGARHESEGYVCLLLDSLLKRYPIGGVVLWETDEAVPYRAFVQDYAPGQFARLVDRGRWGAPKSLVYDGQQRLQTLYTVLYHRFNGRTLHFDILFNAHEAEADETGFLFRDEGASPEPRYLRMTELISKKRDQRDKVRLEKDLVDACSGDEAVEFRIRENLTDLWEVFVDTNIKSIACFMVRNETPDKVNEIFRRLNTGGVALTQLELVLSKIKEVDPCYEQELWTLSEQIAQRTGGIEFASADILQFFHLMVKGTTRIDEERLASQDVASFQRLLTDESEPLVETFDAYLAQLFTISHASIVPRWLAVLPIAAYLTERMRAGHEWRIRALPAGDLALLHQYFLLSQFCDWNTQTMVNAFARSARAAGAQGTSFPLDDIREVALQKNRTGTLHDYQFLDQPWLATKVLMPTRAYVFHERKPQVDHIFPLELANSDDLYRGRVDVLWNLQPMSAEVNNYKRTRHPKEFFNSTDGSKYWNTYDFIPPGSSPLWDDYREFLRYREEKMREALLEQYGLNLEVSTVARGTK